MTCSPRPTTLQSNKTFCTKFLGLARGGTFFCSTILLRPSLLLLVNPMIRPFLLICVVVGLYCLPKSSQLILAHYILDRFVLIGYITCYGGTQSFVMSFNCHSLTFLFHLLSYLWLCFLFVYSFGCIAV